MKKNNHVKDNERLVAARSWLSMGFEVLTILPSLKRSRFKWEDWFTNLDDAKLITHWHEYPQDDLAILPGNTLVVLDADTKEALRALVHLETKHGLESHHCVLTQKGQHHYFRIPEGVTVRANSHSTEAHPDRIDVRTGRNQIIVAPSSNKKVLTGDFERIDSLAPVTQAFIDDLMIHNGFCLQSAHQREDSAGKISFIEDEMRSKYLVAMLQHLDPEDGGHEQWLRTVMAVKNVTNDDDEGLEVVDEWSSVGRTYPGRRSIESMWRSLHSDGGVTLGSLIWRLEQVDCDWVEICDSASPQFELCSYQVIGAGSEQLDETGSRNPLKKFSITQSLEEVRANTRDAKPALDPIASQGQATVIYAPPNTGKTLITMHMLRESIRKGYLTGDQVFYINCDDSAKGLLEKGEIAKQSGFEMLAPGYSGFNVEGLKSLMVQMAASGSSRGTVLILDTLKKFVDVMDKSESRTFGSICRAFCMKGGTLIALSHVNKRRDNSGALIYSGTSDIADDFDCVYTLDKVRGATDQYRGVIFKNQKHRGGVAEEVTFYYSHNSSLTYPELLDSVHRQSNEFAHKLERDLKPDESNLAVTAELANAIQKGVTQKMQLVCHVAQVTRSSRRLVSAILDTNVNVLWTRSIGPRGAQVHTLKPIGNM